MVIILNEKMNENNFSEKKRVKIFDTTLRDGEQSPGATMTIMEKIIVAKQLEKMGVDVIEAGFPASNTKDFEAIKEISKIVKNCEVCALARCTKSDIDTAWNAIKDAKKPRIHVFIATSSIHLEHKLKMSKSEVIEKIRENVTYAKSLCKNIEFSAEDATRTDKDFLKYALKTAIKSGASVINIPDSVGYIQPKEYGEIIQNVTSDPDFFGVEVSVHCHDDLGMAVANSLTGIENGATQIECTINGIGERAGNASLEEIVMAMKTRNDYYNFESGVETCEIIPTSKMVSTITKMFVQKNKAIVGENAFAHEAGIHQHGVIANTKCYEIVDASALGVKSEMIIGVHSGKHAIIEFMQKEKIPTTEKNVEIALGIVKNAQKGENLQEKIKENFIQKEVVKM